MNRETQIVPVLLCGGSGTRLWPLSRSVKPKQFAPLVGPATLILEPVARNTAPAIAAAALAAQESGDDPVLVVLPSDHLIGDAGAFHGALDRAVAEAESGALVTFGVVPTEPATGYGYIRSSEIGAEISDVEAFVEKPDVEAARAYLESGRYLWNSGMFVFRAGRFLEELQRHRPEMVDRVREAWAAREVGPDFSRLAPEAFEAVRGESIDYAVMEHASAARVVALEADWNDVGSWDALWSVSGRDDDGNVVQGDCVTVDTRDSYVRSEMRLVATVGLRDQIVVETADAVLVAPRDRAQEVGRIVERLRSMGRDEARLPARVPRPWGDYESLDRGEGYQVKRITVVPGAALSVQKHHHRAEHWTVVQGTARVLCDDREFDLEENESTFIPLGAIHRLENRGSSPLVLIEVQCGAYLGEDDIVRFEDRYGRVEG